MSNRRRSQVLALLLAVPILPMLGFVNDVHAQAPSLLRIFSDPPLGGRPPQDLQLSPDGEVLAFLRPNAQDSEVLDLWGQRLPGGEAKLLVASVDLLGAGTQKLTEAERMALERRRITQSGITSFMWCGKDASAVLFPLSGDLYWARLVEGGKPEVSRLTNDDAVPELAPQCSPEGHFVSYTKKGDLHVLDIATRKEKRLSKRAAKHRTVGLAEFIAEEEMDRHQGHWWSKDERRLLAFEVDESGVGVKVRPLIHADRTELFEQRYPAAGEANAKVTAHLFDRQKGKAVAVKLPAEDGYLPRAGFFADGTPWLQWQSRDQRRMVLFEVDKNGALRQLAEETDPAWVALHSDLRSLEGAFANSFLWSSERSGRRQLELVDRQTGARTALTDEPEAVDRVVGLDRAQGLVYYVVARERGRERHVHAVPLTGGPSRPIAAEPGWHLPTFSGSGTRFIDVHSSWAHPPKTLLREPNGQSTVLDDNPTPELDALPKPELIWRDFQAADGSVMNGLLLAPAKREAKRKYPVIAWVYGGPMHQSVTNRWMRHYPLLVHLTERGYGVLMVDNRGAGGRGRDLDRAHFRAFGDVEVKDLFGAVSQLKSVDWVDSAKVGVWGWSYGGYLAARAVLDEATPFSAAVGIAPVSDWTLYDTHYTERYLGLPDGGKAAPYVSSNLVPRAKLLDKPLMLIHGTADDNVLFEHSLRLVDALQKESLPFELMIYPGKAHGIGGRAAQRHVYLTSFEFFDRHLR